jgi:hypothetical protein
MKADYINEKEGFFPRISFFCKSGELSELGQDVADIISRQNIWLVTMGAKGSECLSNFSPGSDTFSVIKHVTCAVLLIPPTTRVDDIKRMAIVEENPSYSKQLVKFVSEFETLLSTTIVSCYLPTDIGPLHYYNKRQLEKQLNVSINEITEDEITEQLHNNAPELIDLLVLDLSYKSNLKSLIYGPIAKILISNETVPLLVISQN